MKPFYQDNHNTLYCLDFRKNELPDECVQAVCTSPPYWGLRKYSGLPDLIWGGDEKCEHRWISTPAQESYSGRKRFIHSHDGDKAQRINRQDDPECWEQLKQGDFCSLCGAWKGAYGLEPTPEMYIEHTVEILREIRRVLRKDGVVFWNCGDSYWGGGNNRGNKSPISDKQASNIGATGQCAEHQKNIGKHPTLKPKDLCLIPFRVAISAQADGWYVRSVIIWSKKNPMPESVTDRPTESHEYILMLTKSARYYWDAEAVREPQAPSTIERYGKNPQITPENIGQKSAIRGSYKDFDNYATSGILLTGRNIRSVWEFPTQPYPAAHFAVFPEKLPEICIKAATPEVGCCSKCGAPWERITDVNYKVRAIRAKTEKQYKSVGGSRANMPFMGNKITETLGWQPTCKCNADKVPSIILDPFAGSGTTLWVAKKLNRRAVGYELSEEYCQLALERCRQQVLL